MEYRMAEADYLSLDLAAEPEATYDRIGGVDQTIRRLEEEMKAAAKELEFERAAGLRDRIRALRLKELEVSR